MAEGLGLRSPVEGEELMMKREMLDKTDICLC